MIRVDAKTAAPTLEVRDSSPADGVRNAALAFARTVPNELIGEK